jgi:eukaryotic-like serine/threonine-protein kinase
MTAIAHYNLLEKIADGDLGEVYRARDTRVGRTVAVKLIPLTLAADSARRQRLLEAARAASTLSHPNIATLFDVGEEDGKPYLVYEFADGRTLGEELTGGPLNPRHALDIAVQLADGAADGHAHGIVHGDLRLDTVMVTAKGSAKILDFGLAPWTRGGALRASAARDPDALPPEARRVLAYLSPEQAIGGAVDARTDVFTLATITYEMLTGKNPFAGTSATETVVNVIQGKVTPPSEVNPGVSKDVDAILMHALSRDLEARQQSAASLAAELRSVAAMLDVRTGDAAEPSVLMKLDESPDKPALGLVLIGLAAAAGAAAVVWWWLSR